MQCRVPGFCFWDGWDGWDRWDRSPVMGPMGLMGLILMMGQSLSEREPLESHQTVDRHSPDRHREVKPRKTRKPAPPDTEGDWKSSLRTSIDPLARNPCETEGLPVLNPKEDFSNCFPRPAKRVSAHSVVDYAYAPHPAIRGQTGQSAKEYKPQKYISTRQPMLQD